MKVLYITIIGIIISACAAQHKSLRVDTPAGIVELHNTADSIYIGTIVKNIRERILALQNLKNIYPGCYDEISQIVAQLSMLVSLVPKDATSISVPVNIIEPMSAEAFANFFLLLEDEAFADDKLLLFKQVIAKNYITSHQLGKILDQFTLSDEKFEVIKISLPRLIDQENTIMLRDKFELDSDKEQFMKLISE